jgi:GNAT superfamily N-acetyltransferase
MGLAAPAPLLPEHETQAFDSGVASLDAWLKSRAQANQKSGASRTYVATKGGVVVGYYCLASGSLALAEAPWPVRRNMPDPVPMVILGRLAVDKGWQGKGLGASLLQDAVLRTRQAASILGIRAMLTHALSDTAKAFYEHNGFLPSPTQPMTLMLQLTPSG